MDSPVILDPSQTDPATGALLHGRLTIHVLEARNIEGGKSASFFQKLERVVTSSIDGVDPYVSVKLGYNKVMQTSVIQNSQFPVWNAKASFPVCHDVSAVEFRLKAAKRQGPLSIISKVKHLSMLSIAAADLESERSISGWFPLTSYQGDNNPEDADASSSDSDDDENRLKTSSSTSSGNITNLGEIYVEVLYEPVTEIDLSPVHVKEAYFPVRHGVNVTLYQDADCPPGLLPPVPFKPDYKHARCWAEIARAIMASTKFIYITGWAVWPELVMVRSDASDDNCNGLTLGEMLLQKAEEGLLVCVMVWDELASGRYSKGVMGTHDEDMVSYFKKSKVHAIKVPRKNAKDGPFSDIYDSFLFTHHQKTVMVTREDPETGKHRVEAWVGGLDLTDGRYDNAQHSLFRTLDTLHAPPDFWQACALNVSAESGPREPWHDIHSKVTGAAAWDVLTNFEGRWARQAPESEKSALHTHGPMSFIQPAEEDARQEGSWSVQVLRSISEGSSQLDTDRPGLVVRASANTDQSIHNSYIHNIRTAKHFIYIENQYFIGSSHMWNSGQRGGFAANLVPIEIAEKICTKIRADERFAVYVVIPMFPEGPPASLAVQEILSHQRKTIALITTRIAKVIRETGSSSQVTDWFNVFCLVNRESMEGNIGNGGTSIEEQQLSQSRRFMIYIHSKFAIFDDSVTIVGSANINSRSLDGSRDTEIAIAAWEPDNFATGSTGYSESEAEFSLPQGDVAAFRASIFSEHLGEYLPEFDNPSSLDCVSKVNELAQANWDHFADDTIGEVTDMPFGHLARYPYIIDPETGEVTSVQETFPDFEGALIKGQANPGLPNVLTG